jgi:hypothetical protein
MGPPVEGGKPRLGRDKQGVAEGRGGDNDTPLERIPALLRAV